jgi:hypothetical protein
MRLAVHAGQDLQAETTAANRQVVANNPEELLTTLFCSVIE